jgi:ATP phosphoribosyltransferase
MLTLALPNGSLKEPTERLFQRAGIDLSTNFSRRHWIDVWHSLVFKIIWLKARDIPEVIADGRMAQVGIAGNDFYNEWFYQNQEKKSLLFVQRLCYGKNTSGPTKIALVKAIDEPTRNWPEPNEEVVTELPYWTSRLLPNIKVKAVTGSVEAYIGHGFRFGVVLVETGRSLNENCLIAVKVLATSFPEIYANREFVHVAEVRELGNLLIENGTKRKEDI